MGEMHSKAVFTLETTSQANFDLFLALTTGGVATIVASYLQYETQLRSNGLVLGII